MENYNDVLNNEAFKCVEKEKLELIKQLAEKTKGKSAMEAIDIFGKYSAQLTKGKELSPVERDAIIAVIKSNMNAGERKKLDEIMSMLKSMGRL